MKYTPRNRKQWRAWLAKNHAGKTEVWLVFRKKSTGKPNLSYNDAVEEALCFGWIDGIKKSLDDDHYMHRFSPRKPDSNWSGSNIKRVNRLLSSGQMTPAGKKLVDAAKKSGKWAKPHTVKTEFAVPPEFEARLKRSKKAAAFFASLAPSYKKQYVAWIATAKREDTRNRRLDEVMERLKQGRKLGMK